MRHNKWLVPICLTVLALVLFFGGIAWAVGTGVAVPDQDPTPEMRAYARFHERIASVLMLCGCATFVLAVLSVIIVKLFPPRARRGFSVIHTTPNPMSHPASS
jgi:hypothetical protein